MPDSSTDSKKRRSTGETPTNHPDRHVAACASPETDLGDDDNKDDTKNAKAPTTNNSNKKTKHSTATTTTTRRTEKPPKTVLDKIVYAIRHQPTTTSKGVSRVALCKYLKSEWNCDNASAIKKALKQGVDKGNLIQSGQSFRVAGDPIPEPTEPEARVEIQTMKPGATSQDGTTGAQHGDTVVVNYKGTLSDGRVFDAAPSFEFVLGAGEVIAGWEHGIAGMMVGEVRQLIVPPKLGYGKRGAPPEIPPNATLHFTVTLRNRIPPPPISNRHWEKQSGLRDSLRRS